jgi:hypothetical protein
MLRPVEYVYLLIALAIVGQQILERQGSFDPVASGVALAFIGLIPAGRLDRKAGDGGGESLLVRLLRALTGEDGTKR